MACTALHESHLSSQPRCSVSHTWSSLHGEMSRQLPQTRSFSFLFGSSAAHSGACARAHADENTYLCNHAHRSQYQLGELLCHKSRARGYYNYREWRIKCSNSCFHQFNLPLKLAPRGPDSLLWSRWAGRRLRGSRPDLVLEVRD